MLVRVLLLTAMVILMVVFMIILVRMMLGPRAADRLLAGTYASATLIAILVIDVVLSERAQLVPAIFLLALLACACGLSVAGLGSRRRPSSTSTPTG